MTSRNLLHGLLWAGVTILCWAPLFSVAKRTMPVVDAFALGTLRYAVGTVFLGALLVAVEGRRALSYEGRFAQAAFFGVIGITGFNLLVWLGLTLTLPEHASVILALQPPIAALVVWLARGQRPAAFTLGCVAAAIVGVFIVITRGDPAGALEELVRSAAASPGSSVLLGDLLVLCGALAWVTYTLAAGHFAGWSPLRMTVLTCIPGGAGLALANALAVYAGWSVLPSAAALASVWWEMVYFALGTVTVGILAFNNATRRLGPLNTMLMLSLLPVLVFAIEAALGRRFAAIELAGAAIVVGALVANNLYLRGTSSRR